MKPFLRFSCSLVVLATSLQVVLGQNPNIDFSRIEAASAHQRYASMDEKPLKFTARAQYVLVPVVVLDKNGKPVSALKKEDFKIFENGKEQKISSLDEIKSNADPVRRVSHSPSEFTNQTEGSNTNKKLTIVAIDMINTPFLDQTRAREAIISFFADGVQPDTLYELISLEPNGVRVLHEFTTDTNLLIATLKQTKGSFNALNKIDQTALNRIPSPGAASISATPATFAAGDANLPNVESANIRAFTTNESMQNSFYGGLAAGDTFQNFQQIANRFAGISGRKSLIWVTGSFPFEIEQATGAVSEGLSNYSFQRAMQSLANANVAVYPVDARGLLPLMTDATVHMSKSDIALVGSLDAGRGRNHQETLDTLRSVADMTGGRAYFNTNDITSAVRDASNDGAVYYMLSYPLDKGNTRAGWRKLKVSVADKDLRIRARSGYYATQATLDSAATAGGDINTALNSPFESTGLPLHVTFDPMASAGSKKKVHFALVLPPKAAAIDEADGNHFNVEIAYQVRDEKGKDAGHNGQSYNLKLAPEQIAAVQNTGIGYDNALELAPGHYNFHFAVRDNISGKVGSLVAPVDVK
jgi:VWFA-related protein